MIVWGELLKIVIGVDNINTIVVMVNLVKSKKKKGKSNHVSTDRMIYNESSIK